MSRRFTLSISSIICYLTFMISFFNTNYFAGYNTIKYISLVLIGLYIAKYSQILLHRKFLLVNLSLILFSVFVVISAYFNLYRDTERNPFLAAIVFSGSLIEMFFIAEVMSEKGNSIKMVNIYYKAALIITIITEFIAIFLPSFAATNQDSYLIGTKFQVVYMHYLIIAFYLTKNELIKKKSNIRILILLCVWAIFASVFTQCSTGVVGITLLIVFLVIFREKRNVLISSNIFLLTLLFSFAFVFIFSFILNNPLAEYVVVDLLHRDMTLSSRTVVFSRALNLLQNNLMWGFGYGLAYELGIQLAGIPNTQNAILNWVWQCGVVTTVLMVVFMLMIFYCSKRISRYDQAEALKPLCILIYIFAILGAIEVTFNSTFFGLLAALLLLSNKNPSIIK